MKLLYDSIPDSVKQDVWERFKKCTSKEIVKSQKTIDITQLYKNMVINLVLKSSDYENHNLKIIHIITRNGIYYLYLRDYYDLKIDNDGCFLDLHFYVRDNI